MNPYSMRHAATQELMRWFSYSHLPEGSNARFISEQCWVMADRMVWNLSDGPELTAGLRKLLEAKDCFVRQASKDQEAA